MTPDDMRAVLAEVRYERAAAAERARMRERVEALVPMPTLAAKEPPGWFYDGWNEAIDAVLATLDESAT